MESLGTIVLRIGTVIIIAFGIGWAVAGSFVTMMPNEETALVASSSCGSWGLEQNPVSEAEDKDDLILGQKETRAGQYVRNCYPPTQGANLDQCSLFRNAYIPSTKIEKHICPFVDGSYCDAMDITLSNSQPNL